MTLLQRQVRFRSLKNERKKNLPKRLLNNLESITVSFGDMLFSALRRCKHTTDIKLLGASITQYDNCIVSEPAYYDPLSRGL